MCSKTEMQLQKKAKCPMKGNYQVNDVLYKRNKSIVKKMYIGLGERKRKRVFYNHKLSFEQNRYSYKTIFSSRMWRLKSLLTETPNLKVVYFEMRTTILKYLKEMLLVII